MSSFSMTPWDKSVDSRERGTRASKTDVKIGGMTNKRKKKLTTSSSLYASGHSFRRTRPIPIDHKQ